MEITQEENPQSSEIPLGNHDQPSEDLVPRQEELTSESDVKEAEVNFRMSDEEIKAIMENIAATGQFWHEWEELKNILSFRLKQVLAEYPESQVENDHGSQSESVPDIARRLDEVLSSFIEGPPFTLQRLCEILLAPRTLYPKLSKLTLALEKNLLVTSTLTRSTEPLEMDELEGELEGGPELTNDQVDEASEVNRGEDTEMVEARTEDDKPADTPKDESGSKSVEDHA